MADTEFQLLRVIATEELKIPDRRLRPKDKDAKKDPDQTPSLPLSPEELLEIETEIIDVDLKDLLKRLLTKDPTKRITLKEVKRHPWVLTGILDPCTWVEATDPERMSDGNRIQVTVEDVEKAVSSAGVLGRARSAVKRAVEWGKGLRRRASSTANVLSTGKDKEKEKEKEKEKGSSGRKAESEAVTRAGSASRPGGEYEHGEWHWVGSNPTGRDGNRSPLPAGPVVNSTSDTSGYGGESLDPNSPRRSRPEYQSLQKKPSVALSAPMARRHTPTGSDPSGVANRSLHRTHASFPVSSVMNPPQVSKSDCSLRTPSHGHSGSLIGNGMRRVVRSMRSGGFSDHVDKEKVKAPASREDSPFRAVRADHSFYAYGNGQLHVQVPNNSTRRHSYAGIDAQGPSLEVARPVAVEPKHRWERDISRRFAAFTMKEKPANPNYDEAWERDQQRALQKLEMAKENYHPTQDSPTPPMMMGRRSSRLYGDREQLPLNSCQQGQLVSSSSEEQFVTTAGSSLTGSTSFPSAVPSIVSETSSISSEFFNSRYSRKNSIAGPVHEESDAEYRPSTPFHNKCSRLSNIDAGMDADLDDDGGEDGGDESDGGFVMEVPRSKKKSVAAGNPATGPVSSTKAALPHARRRRRSSSSTNAPATKGKARGGKTGGGLVEEQ